MWLVGIVSFSRLYLGTHWMSDVLGSLTLGMDWVALLSIAYLQHARNEHLPAMSLAGVARGILLLAGAAAVATQYPADLVRHAPQPAAAPVLLADWQATGWRLLPARRTAVDGDHKEPFTVQWAGAAVGIASVLQAGGRRQPPPWTLQTAASWLLPGTPVGQLPVLEKVHRGAPAALRFERMLGPSQRLVLRLWPTGHVVDVVAQTPSAPWIGMLTVGRIQRPAHAFTLVSTEPDFAAALARFTTSLKARGLRWDLEHRDAGPVALLD